MKQSPQEMSAEELEAAVERHDRLYWIENRPEIADTEYDLLVERLRSLRPSSPILQRVGAGQLSLIDSAAAGSPVRVTHGRPMLSLEKCYSEAELLKWFSRFRGPAIASHKIDGLAVALRYDSGGDLTLGATRGDGEVGEVVTENVRRVRGVPARIEARDVEIRGEAWLPLDEFQTRWSELFANPRNLAAGALKQKDPDATEMYGLRFLAYELIGDDSVRTERGKLDRLRALGFEAITGTPCEASEAQGVFERLAGERSALDYETDGVVFKIDDLRQQHEAGSTAHHPRYAIAYKYQGESGQTVLQDVEWSVSRTGSVNPVALVSPVALSGVTVSRVSLHNLSVMEKLGGSRGLGIGSKVVVTRRGGVIPHIEEALDAGERPIQIPIACPSCGAPTRREDDFLMADHAADCSTAARRRLEHFSAVIDARGVGPKLMEQLHDRNLVREPSDLYRLAPEDLARLDRMGTKSAENIVRAIAARRTLRLATFLEALGIEGVGGQVAETLEAGFPDLAALRRATPEELGSLHGIGPILARTISGGLAAMAPQLDRLLAWVTVERPAAAGRAEGPLDGKRFVFTGELESMGRKEAAALVRRMGGQTPDSVSARVDFLVLGNADFERFQSGWRSGKLKKADELQAAGAAIRVVGETEFLRMIGRS